MSCLMVSHRRVELATSFRLRHRFNAYTYAKLYVAPIILVLLYFTLSVCLDLTRLSFFLVSFRCNTDRLMCSIEPIAPSIVQGKMGDFYKYFRAGRQF